MRFSSDEELFEQNSNNQQQPNANPKANLKKKQKKETMLSRFLDSLNQNVITKLHNYEKLKRPIFERRAMVPPKLSLYEDVLFILIFKENQQKILSDSKQIKTICLDLESRTKRKQCTIRQRVQKKLCKMSPQELLDHVSNDKDISFNLKKVLISGGKVQSEKTINRSEIQISSVKEKLEQNRTPMKKQKMNTQQIVSEQKDYDKVSMKLENSPSKLDDQIFFEKQQNNKDQIKEEVNESHQTQQINDNEIFIVFKKNDKQGDILMFNKVLIQKEINQIKRKQQQQQQRQQLMKQLKIQMDIIMHFKNKTTSIPQEVKALILQAQKIMRILGINSLVQVQNQANKQKINQKIVQEKQQSTNKIHQQTADKNVQTHEQNTENQNEGQTKNVSQFHTIEQIEQEENNQNKQSEQKEVKYTISYALCNNDEYIKLYNSDSEVFEPLLWTEDEDILIDKLIEDFKQNEKLFNLLVRYKGPEWFIERCIFLEKRMINNELNDAVKACKPLNLSRLNGHLSNFENIEEKKEENSIMREKVNEMGIEC